MSYTHYGQVTFQGLRHVTILPSRVHSQRTISATITLLIFTFTKDLTYCRVLT